MPHLSTHARLLAVGLGCTGLGAGIGAIASAGAATGDAGASHAAAPAASQTLPARAARRSGLGMRLGRAVHAEIVVATRQGFRTIVFDRGFVQSVSGSTLTVREGTATATFRMVTFTIPAGARIRNNRRVAALSSLSSGEHVLVMRAPARTTVVARTAKRP